MRAPRRAEVFDAFGDASASCARTGPGPAAPRASTDSSRRRSRRTRLIRPADPWYVGRPVMVTRNDHVLRLYNGDVGIVLPDPDDAARLTVAFPGGGTASRAASRPRACRRTRPSVR